MSQSITKNAWLFACQWYKVDEIHRSIQASQQERDRLGHGTAVPADVQSVEFAIWLTDQYRLAMRKGAELAISEMMDEREAKRTD